MPIHLLHGNSINTVKGTLTHGIVLMNSDLVMYLYCTSFPYFISPPRKKLKTTQIDTLIDDDKVLKTTLGKYLRHWSVFHSLRLQVVGMHLILPQKSLQIPNPEKIPMLQEMHAMNLQPSKNYVTSTQLYL